MNFSIFLLFTSLLFTSGLNTNVPNIHGYAEDQPNLLERQFYNDPVSLQSHTKHAVAQTMYFDYHANEINYQSSLSSKETMVTNDILLDTETVEYSNKSFISSNDVDLDYWNQSTKSTKSYYPPTGCCDSNDNSPLDSKHSLRIAYCNSNTDHDFYTSHNFHDHPDSDDQVPYTIFHPLHIHPESSGGFPYAVFHSIIFTMLMVAVFLPMFSIFVILMLIPVVNFIPIFFIIIALISVIDLIPVYRVAHKILNRNKT